mmetsp:Transcript_34587/g.75754  ORF Transcript_34587/g.75754 Transcript_34587/m.75754 type:complete len:238 (+) Transcript_34587:1698-2411(+)
MHGHKIKSHQLLIQPLVVPHHDVAHIRPVVQAPLRHGLVLVGDPHAQRPLVEHVRMNHPAGLLAAVAGLPFLVNGELLAVRGVGGAGGVHYPTVTPAVAPVAGAGLVDGGSHEVIVALDMAVVVLGLHAGGHSPPIRTKGQPSHVWHVVVERSVPQSHRVVHSLGICHLQDSHPVIGHVADPKLLGHRVHLDITRAHQSMIRCCDNGRLLGNHLSGRRECQLGCDAHGGIKEGTRKV